MIALGTAATRYWRTSLVAAAFAAAPLLLGSAAWNQGNAQNSPALKLLTTIPIPVTPQNAAGKMLSDDISWVDPTPIPGHPMGLYYLADRDNKALDVVDVATDTMFGQIGGSGAGQANFKGVVFNPTTGLANTAASGPDGVVAAFPCIFAGDGDSRLLSFAAPAYSTVVSALNTGGQFRVDEMAVDIADGLVIAANNADDPPFSTIATYNKTTCALSNPIKTLFNALPGGHVATNGIEQPVWDPTTKRFYVSLPEIDGPGDGTGPNGTGAVARITTGGVVEQIYPINFCSPAGLTVGPNGDLLVGCNTTWGLDGKKCGNLVPAPSATGTAAAKPTTCTASANPQSAICNPGRGCTGNALVSVPGAGGGDEVYFNSGDGNYYVTGGNDPKGPLLGVVSSKTNTVTQVVPTLPPVAAVPFKTASGTAHSVATSAANNHVYLPLPANFYYPNCATGCIAVFSAQ